MAPYLVRGSEHLRQYPGFRLVARDSELKRLAAILMRSRANSVLIVGPGGVGCTALCLGLQALKDSPSVPFDVVSKRLFWLDVDGLFGNGADAAEAFKKIMSELARTPEAVLIVEDARDLVEAARSANLNYVINALANSVKVGKLQVVLEVRDDDLDVVLKCHSDIRECFTVLDLEEPAPDALRQIVAATVPDLVLHHGIAVTDEAAAAAIELTNKYRTRDLGLSRAQPERAVTLIDRALASYRLAAHECPPPDTSAKEWLTLQTELKNLYAAQRDGEVAILGLEEDLDAQRKSDVERGSSSLVKKTFVGIATVGGFETPEAQEIRLRIRSMEDAVTENKAKFDALTKRLNASLRLSRQLVLREFSAISGIAVSKLGEDERAKLAGLEARLRTRIFGQDRILSAVAAGVAVSRLGRRTKGTPLAFLFLGPSGVGKTELAKALAEALLDDEAALTRFDMSEYMEKHAVAKLIGAPPGYEGFDVGGILTNAMRRNPNRVLLFDEIEKAHPDVFNLFLQVLSDGRLTDNVGRTCSFADAVVLMTTNIGQAHALSENEDPEVMHAAMLAELANTYRSEFLNRFAGRQNILCFDRLDLGSMAKIVRRELDVINATYKDQGISVIMPDQEISLFCRDRYDPAIGARGLPGYMSAHLEAEIVRRLLADQTGRMVVAWVNKQFAISYLKAEAA